MDIWHGVFPRKVNPFTRIKRIVENYHFEKDIQRARTATCPYTSLTIFDWSGSPFFPGNKRQLYRFDARLTKIGQLSNSEHRRLFLYALLDTGGYERQCRHCGKGTQDLTDHCIKECNALEHARQRFKLMMLFYNAPVATNLKHKDNAFSLAFSEKYFMKAWCEFLKDVWSDD